MKTFGELILNYRKTKSLSQKELGERLDRSQNTISNYEKNISFPPNLEEISLIASILNEHLEYVIKVINYSKTGVEDNLKIILNLDEYEQQSRYEFSYQGTIVSPAMLKKALILVQALEKIED